jgi:hypothetical protein
MHRCADVFRRNENVRLAPVFRGEKRITSWMDGYLPGYQISLSRKDVSILPDARDLTSAFEVAQRFAQRDSRTAAHANFPSDLNLVQRPIIFPRQERENLFPDLRSICDHLSETIWSGLSI